MTVTRDIAAMVRALASRLPGGEAITGLRQLTTGHSNDTYGGRGAGRHLRLPPATTPLMAAHDIIVQARVYAELGAATGGPPVPRVDDICTDPALLGAPFFVMERVAGGSIDDIPAARLVPGHRT